MSRSPPTSSAIARSGPSGYLFGSAAAAFQNPLIFWPRKMPPWGSGTLIVSRGMDAKWTCLASTSTPTTMTASVRPLLSAPRTSSVNDVGGLGDGETEGSGELDATGDADATGEATPEGATLGARATD